MRKPAPLYYVFTALAFIFAAYETHGELKITSPGQADTLKIGSQIRISWTGSALPVNLYYSDGFTKKLIDIGNKVGYFDWTVPENDSLKFNFIVEEIGSLSTELVWGKENAHDDEIRTCQISPDGKFALTSGRDDIARIWDIDKRAGYRDVQVLGDKVNIYAAQFLHTSDSIVIAFNKSIVIYDSKSGSFLYYFWVTGLFNDAKFIDVHPIEDQVAIAGDNGVLLVLNLNDITNIKRLSVPGDRNIYSVRFTPDGNYLLAGADDGKIYRYDWRKRKLLSVYGKHQDAAGQSVLVWSAAGFPDGARILSGGADNRARIWRVSDSTELADLTTHTFFVRSVDISPQGDEFLTASLDSTLRLWDAEDYVERVPPINHGGQILFARYSSGGDSIITAGRDRSFKIWRKVRPEPVADSVECAALYPLIVKMSDVYGEPGETVNLYAAVNKPYDTELNRTTFPKGKLTVRMPCRSLLAIPTGEFPSVAKTDYDIILDAEQFTGSDTIARVSATALLSGELKEKTELRAFKIDGRPAFYPVLEGGIVQISEPCKQQEASALVRSGKILELKTELVQNLLSIKTFAQGAWELTIFDGAGKAVLSREYDLKAREGSEIELDVSSLPSGRYIARLSGRDEAASRAFLIVR